MPRSILAVALLATIAACGSAGEPGEPTASTSSALVRGSPYLALGDSIAFGFSPLLSYDPPFTQFVGYPESAGAADGLPVWNAACPGETSGSFLDPAQPDNGCHSPPSYFDQGLHVAYGTATSQIEYATSFLRTNGATGL